MKYLIPVAFSLVAICSGVGFAQGPYTPVDTLEVSIEQGIQLVLQQEVPHTYGTPLILRAGASRDPAYILLLKEVVDSWAPGGSSNSAYFHSNDHFRPYEMHTAAALHSLWLLGEGEGYFLRNIRDWREDYMLAYQSALILARTPTPEFIAYLERTCEESENPFGSQDLWGALSKAQQVAYLIEEYDQMGSERMRADSVIDQIVGWWSPDGEEYWMNPTGSGWTEIRYTEPKSVVFWEWFRALSRDQLAVLAGAIRDVPMQHGDHTLTQAEAERLRAWLSYMAALPMR